MAYLTYGNILFNTEFIIWHLIHNQASLGLLNWQGWHSGEGTRLKPSVSGWIPRPRPSDMLRQDSERLYLGSLVPLLKKHFQCAVQLFHKTRNFIL